MIRSLVAFAVARRVTILMATLAVLAFGMVGYSRLTMNLLPDISYPSLTVQTEFPDAAPLEVENLITRPIEEAIGVLSGLQSVHSVSRSGGSEVILEFAWNTDMDLLSMDAREKLDRLVLPEDAEEPIVLRFDPSLEPIVRMALHGGDDLIEMRHMADRRIKQMFETVRGVAAAQIKGGLEEEIQVNIDQGRLAVLGIPLSQVANVLQSSNINLPGGALRDLQTQYLVRTINEYESIEEIAALVVAQRTNGAPIYLRDLATVKRGYQERVEITRVNGTPSVEIAIFKEGDANTVEVAKALQARIEEVREDLPAGVTLTILFDQSTFITQSLSDVRQAALLGGILAIIILFVFLRDLRSALIIATSIPISIVATFICMYRFDVSLNIMSLGGLTLGIGMLVDNSIVVLESIYRSRERCGNLMQAAITGTSEVGSAVIASTLTTVSVFVPILFVEGVAGQLFRDQALTVTMSLLCSLAVALTLIPTLSAVGKSKRRNAQSKIALNAKGSLGRVSQAYDSLLRTALRLRYVTLFIGFACFALALRVLPQLGTELVPELDQGEYYFEANLKEGSSLSATDRVLLQLERVARQNQPTVSKYYTSVGSRQVAGGLSLQTRGENLGQINLVFDGASRQQQDSVLAALRREIDEIPDLRTKLGTPSYLSLSTPVEIVLFGESLEDLRHYSDELVPALQGIPGLTDLRSSMEPGNPELQVVFNRQRLAALGLNMATLSQVLHDRVQGTVPSLFREADRQIDIRVRNQEVDRNTLASIRNLVVAQNNGISIPLTSVADIKLARGPAEIHRLQQQRAAVITGNLSGRSLGKVLQEVQQVLEEQPPSGGISAELGGQNTEMQVSFDSLKFALALAVFLVYLVMAATFESLIHPLVILCTIPLALVGVVLGLGITQTSISVIVLIGVILLAGIVVNNAIVLVDAINRGRQAGLDKLEAIVQAGHLRMRPILMTTLTTICGLLPMALGSGEGSELRAPLAITVAFGLGVSTFLTLVVIPAAYMIVPSSVGQAADLELNAHAAPDGGQTS